MTIVFIYYWANTKVLAAFIHKRFGKLLLGKSNINLKKCCLLCFVLLSVHFYKSKMETKDIKRYILPSFPFASHISFNTTFGHLDLWTQWYTMASCKLFAILLFCLVGQQALEIMQTRSRCKREQPSQSLSLCPRIIRNLHKSLFKDITTNHYWDTLLERKKLIILIFIVNLISKKSLSLRFNCTFQIQLLLQL